MRGQTCSVTLTSARPAARANRTASSSNVSDEPLDQRRRKAMQIGKQRRDRRILAIDRRRRVGIREFLEISLVNERIDVILVLKGSARHRQVGPGRCKPRARRLLLACSTKAIDQGDGEI